MLDWDPIGDVWTVDGVRYADEASARAAEERGVRMAGVVAGDSPTATADEVVAARVYLDILPSTLELYGKVRSLQEFWDGNDMSVVVAAAMSAGTTVAGYPPEHLAQLGQVLNDLLAWLDEPAGVGLPPRRKILMRRVTPVTGAG